MLRGVEHALGTAAIRDQTSCLLQSLVYMLIYRDARVVEAIMSEIVAVDGRSSSFCDPIHLYLCFPQVALLYGTPSNIPKTWTSWPVSPSSRLGLRSYWRDWCNPNQSKEISRDRSTYIFICVLWGRDPKDRSKRKVPGSADIGLDKAGR